MSPPVRDWDKLRRQDRAKKEPSAGQWLGMGAAKKQKKLRRKKRVMMATERQRGVLERHGYDAGRFTVVMASQLIGMLAGAGWVETDRIRARFGGYRRS